jgi:hypothetical protein
MIYVKGVEDVQMNCLSDKHPFIWSPQRPTFAIRCKSSDYYVEKRKKNAENADCLYGALPEYTDLFEQQKYEGVLELKFDDVGYVTDSEIRELSIDFGFGLWNYRDKAKNEKAAIEENAKLVREGFRLFSDQDALNAKNFLEGMLGKTKDGLISCDAGMSRSRALAVSFAFKHGLEIDENADDYYPLGNLYVFKKMRKVLGI